MSVLFDRVGIIEISSSGGTTTIDGLRFDFAIRKSRSDTPNDATVRIYNAAPSTRNLATDIDADIRLICGYKGNAALITEANITNATTIRQPPELYLEIDAQEGIRALRETELSISHGGGSTVRQVLDEIVSEMGIDLRPVEFDIDIPLRGGFAHVGKPSKALDDLVRRFDGYWSIQNGELMILPEGGESSSADVPVISPDSGMIGSPEKLQRNTSSEKASSDERDGYRVTSLMLPGVEPGDRIRIESRDVSGEFVADEVEHKGDLRGPEWGTMITAVEPE